MPTTTDDVITAIVCYLCIQLKERENAQVAVFERLLFLNDRGLSVDVILKLILQDNWLIRHNTRFSVLNGGAWVLDGGGISVVADCFFFERPLFGPIVSKYREAFRSKVCY